VKPKYVDNLCLMNGRNVITAYYIDSLYSQICNLYGYAYIS